MASTSSFNDAFKRAVTPGTERLLTGVALAAAARGTGDEGSSPPDFTASYGTLSLDPASAAVTCDTVMWLASCSKLVTTIAVLQCVERGLLHLDDAAEIDRLLPEWKDIEVLTGFTEDRKLNLHSPKEKITLRRLLTHTSGVSYDFIHPLLVQWRQSRGETDVAFHSAVTKGYHHPLVFEPGTGWTYGAGLDLAGLMVARANNTTLEAYMRQNIFDVLGMKNTTFHPTDHNNLIECLMPMTHRAESGELEEGAQIAPVQPVDDHGGAGLFSTAADYLKVLKSILHDDGKLVKSESIDLMFTPALSDAQRDSLNLSLSHPKLAPIMIPGEPMAGTPGAGDWTHGLAGLIGLHDSDDGFQSGWLQWGGAPNLTWWIDRKGGTCGIFATQLYPAGDVKSAFLGKLFHREVVAHFAQ